MGSVLDEVLVQDGYLNLKSRPLERDVLYILCPYGIGDTLYVAALIKSYKEYYNETRQICLILKENQSVIADWFSAVDQKIVSDDIVEKLTVYAIGTQTWRLENFLYGHFKRSIEMQLLPEFEEVCEKNMIARYKQLVFQLPLDCALEPVNLKAVDVSGVIEKYGIDKKTVILMPHAISCPALPEVFWETLAAILIKEGYHVLTNIKDASEAVIKGTEGISESLEVMARICEECLVVISLRSGLCDVLALTDTLLVIINTREYYVKEWNVNNAVDREGIANLLCDTNEKVVGAMTDILRSFGIAV